MPIGPARMPLMDHLGELRMRLVRIVVVMIIAVCVFYLATPTILEFLFLPINDLVSSVIALDPFEAFSVRLSVSLWTSLIACSPIIIWQILAFFLPALKPSERKWFLPTFVAAVLLFVAGVVFCYLVILHPAFQFFSDQAAGMMDNTARAQSYVDIILKFELGFGFAFELPLIVFYLVIFNVVPYKKLRSAWRGVYVGLLVLSACVTPDASPVTMLLMFAAMVGLYECSLLIARVALRSRIKKQEAQAAADEAELEELKTELSEGFNSLRNDLAGE